MTYEEVVAWIHDRFKFGIRPGLTRMDALLDRLDNPQDKLKSVHIAGTNGKGSTTTFLRCLLESQGLNVGTFTSPYIETFNERISINGTPIPDEDLVMLFKEVKPIIDEMDQDESLKNTVEFEILTGMMFHYFYQKKVDIVLVEVGLGGLYDATNVITQPLLSIITTIGLDHMDILGDTIEKIAEQKAGIIKPKVPVIVGKVPNEAFEVIKEVAELNEAPCWRYEQEFHSRYHRPLASWGEVFDYDDATHSFKQLTIPLLGRHQVDNASLGIASFIYVSQKMGLPVADRDFQKGLSQARWPGRMERLSNEPLIVLDGAHNVHAMNALVSNLNEEFPNKQIYTLFGALSTKDVTSMLIQLETVSNQTLYLTEFDYPKSMRVSDYEEIGYNAYPIWQEAFSDMLKASSGEELLLITGSLYFISQVRDELLGGN